MVTEHSASETRVSTEKVRLTDAEKALGEDVRDWGWMRGFTTEAVESIIAARLAPIMALLEADEKFEHADTGSPDRHLREYADAFNAATEGHAYDLRKALSIPSAVQNGDDHA